MNTNVKQAREAIRRSLELRRARNVEAVLRGEFHSRLRLMFPDQGDEAWINHYSEGTEAGTKVGVSQGIVVNRFIDNLVGSTTIEYESDLRIVAKRDQGLAQVREHVAGLIRNGVPESQVRGVLSDTVDWHAYDAELAPGVDPAECTTDNITLSPIDELQVTADDEHAARQLIAFIRKHLAREQSRFLVADLLTLDLGLNSASYKRSMDPLRELVNDGRDADSSIKLATDLWSDFVDYLEGEGGEFRAAAYVDEVYLCVLARLLSANVLNGQAISSDEPELKDILDGTFFEARYQLDNMVEQDYFGWLAKPGHIERVVPIAHKIQQDLYAYDFSRRAEEDLFGRLMAQLGRLGERKLLGQEWTPAWLGRLLAERCFDNLPDHESPRIIDMCCGSGTILAETLKAARARLGLNGITALQDLVTGFDIDPLAVCLAKTTWVVTLVDEIKAANAPIVIPIFHADSLFSVTPITRVLPFFDENDAIPVSLDGTTIKLPAQLVQPENRELFDRIIDWAYDEAVDAREKGSVDTLTEEVAEKFIDGAVEASGVRLSTALRQALIPSIATLAARMAELAVAGRNGIWAFILRNSYRPGLLSGQFNGLVSNPPWLALSRLADNPYRAVLTHRAKAYGIRPRGQSFLHLELGTTHLLHAVDRYLSLGAAVACVVPGTVFNGHHHERFRQRDFLTSARPVPLDISEVWRIEQGTFKYPGAAIIGRKGNKPGDLTEPEIGGFLARQGQLESTGFSIRAIGKERSAWVLASDGFPAGQSTTSNISQQGADLMPRAAVCIDVLNEDGFERRVNTPMAGSPWAFTVKAAKELKGRIFPGNVAPRFIYRMAQSVNLLPFVLSSDCAPVVIPALRDKDGAWRIYDETAIRRMGFTRTARRFRIINKALEDVGNGITLQERIDVRMKLTNQVLGTEGYLVLAGAGGKHICATCLPLLRNNDIVVDQTLYWRVVTDEDEAWYSVGMLGSHAMTEAITPFNPSGAFGERHIHALPYRLMPDFDAENEHHTRIGELTRRIAEQAGSIVAADDYLKDQNKALTARRTRLRKWLWTCDFYRQLDRLCAAQLGTTSFADDAE